jgi:hypothetical protein
LNKKKKSEKRKEKKKSEKTKEKKKKRKEKKRKEKKEVLPFLFFPHSPLMFFCISFLHSSED